MLGMINYFQMDCLKLIRPPSEVFRFVEIYRSPITDVMQVRIVGQTKDPSEINIGVDPFIFENQKGEKRLLKFDAKDLEIVTDDKGSFAFSFSIKAGDKIVIPILVIQGIEKKYDLIIETDAEGKLRKAFAEPLMEFDIVKQFCPRRRVSGGVGVSFYNSKQTFSAVSGEFSNSSTYYPSFFVQANLRRTPNKNIEILASSAVGRALTQNVLLSDMSYRWNSLAVIEESRKQDWIFSIKERVIHPYFRYGLQYHFMPVIRLIAADEASVDNFQYLNASGGFGLSGYSGQRLNVVAYMDLQYPLYASPHLNYNLMFGGAIELAYAFQRNWFAGFNWHGQAHKFTFTRSDTLDQGGKVDVLQSNFNLSLGYLF